MDFVEQINLLDGNKYLVANTVSDNSKVTADFSEYLKKSSNDMTYEEIFSDVSAKTGVSEQLLKAVAQAESGCRSDAVSSCGAMGVMQLMPATARAYGVTDPFDAYENILGGARLLSDLLEKYNGNVTLSLAAYNAGGGNVSKYGGVPPFKETTAYIDKINKLLSNALDNDSTTIEGAQPTQGLSVTETDVVDFPDIQISKNILEKSSQTAERTGTLSYNELLLRRIYETIIAIDTEKEDESGSADFINNPVNTPVSEDVSAASQISTDKDIDASWVSSFVMPATEHAIDSIIKNSPQGFYEAQAYAVSPLIAQLKDI